MRKVVIVFGLAAIAAACSPQQTEVQPVDKTSNAAVHDSLRVSDDELPADGNKPKG